MNLFISQKTPAEIAKNLADKIKAKRKKIKLSQKELALKWRKFRLNLNKGNNST